MAEDSLIQVSQLTAGFRWQFISDRPIALLLFIMIVAVLAYRPALSLWQHQRGLS